ncbi:MULTISPECIES: D-amino acid aminotransferase [Methylomonas]|uniref:Aminodeoxychorismate lyase n=2 Tax=Methylomonas TaxID=416 RepID=A0A126T1E6_9GAMM|nr:MULTISPECIES: D-amino acid aminotransferase [Methylomonas]AMK75912.1 D-amino acid aminotransferase [Methylomonas denitrificans]OAI01299.1 D-amino acid aminotransferase [Methylomonas methanica]TCV79213.1 D-alanine transaminase [Methylomonas methanica]
MTEQVYLSGAYLPLADAKVSVLDRGFLFGDGVYEVIPAYYGRLFRLEDHITRLNNSLNGIRLPLPHSVADWEAIFRPLLADDRDQYIYLQVTRGYAPKRDHGFPEQVVPTIFAMCSDIAPFAGRVNGIKAVTLDDTRWQLCNIKAITLLGNILLRQEALDQGCAEAILVRNGYVVEGAASNLFAVLDGELITPPKSHEILPGITRDVILELAAAHNIPYQEDIIALEALHNASEIWVASSTREIVPVIELDGQQVGDGKPGPVWKRMDDLLQAYKTSLS